MDTVKIDSKTTKMIAHRGVSGLERENTNPAFVAAGNRSYYGIETDVHVSGDGKFVIMHDETTARVSLGAYDINIEESDYSDVENIVLPDLDKSTFRTDIKIPLLKEYIAICKKYDKVCVLEIKNHFDEADLSRMIDEIKETGYIDKVTFISFDLPNCVNTRKLLPDNDVQWLIGDSEITNETADILCENKLNLDIYYKMLNEENINMLHERGVKINCWTCDSKDDAEKLVKLGVDYITSNILE